MDGESLCHLYDYHNTGAGLAACTSLTALDLHSNNVRSGWHYFGQLQKGLPLLTMLDVSNSFFRTFRRSPFSHVSGLTQMLKMSPKLVMLDVSDSGIDTEEAVLLAELLRNAECLQNVNVAGNKAEDDGAMHFLHCLAECPKLTSLTLTENNMSTYGKHKFKDAALMITTLTKLPWHEIVSL
jgi:Leucine-rich repeat (LRR) protein